MKSERTSEWSDVPAKEINKPKERNQQGVKIQFMLSPSDIPAAYRAVDKDGKYIIEFKYLSSPEPTRTTEQGDGVSLEIGKNSRRIYKIILTPKSLCANESKSVEIEIKFIISADNALKEMEKSGILNSGNTDAIRRFLKPATKGKEHLFGELIPSH